MASRVPSRPPGPRASLAVFLPVGTSLGGHASPAAGRLCGFGARCRRSFQTLLPHVPFHASGHTETLTFEFSMFKSVNIFLSGYTKG